MKKFTIPYKLVKNSNSFIIFWDKENPLVSKTCPVRLICDISAEDELIGIELLGFIYYVGEDPSNILPKSKNFDEYGTITYDKPADAFYFKLKDLKSIKQQSIDGELIFNDKKILVALKGITLSGV